ncbi:hypothetical protein SAMN02910353_02450 [Ruminococcus sp. YRD2003]|uniref:hypothetical protein n=1 Tax=Ruminococcus sp. YRD2003 TaxID=1452313 RepID=UPI0008C78A6E|nr:hypothetical protein SAMN02910353_02450 [Ruminococcus flavefaciens]
MDNTFFDAENVENNADNTMNAENIINDNQGEDAEVEKTLSELKTQKQELDNYARVLSLLKDEIAKKETDLKNREDELNDKIGKLDIREKEFRNYTVEQTAEFAEKEKMLKNYEQNVNERNSQLDAKEKYCTEFEVELKERENRLIEQEIKFKQENSDFSEKRAELDAKEKAVADFENKLNNKNAELMKRENSVSEKEASLREKEILHDNKLNAQRLEFEKSLSDERINKLKELDNELAEKRKQCFEEMEKEHEEYVKNLSDREIELKKKISDLDADKKEFDFEKDQLSTEKVNINKQRLIIETIIEKNLEAERKKLNAEKENWTIQIEELCNRINESDEKIRKFDRIVERFGDDPKSILDIIDSKQQKINELNQHILNFDTSKAEGYDSLLAEKCNLEKVVAKYQEEMSEVNARVIENDNLRFKNLALENEKENLNQEIESLRLEVNKCRETISRLNSVVDPADEEQRISEIKKGILPEITMEMVERTKKHQPDNEMQWLDHIENCCRKYGVVFPQRILYAFHTALKISDWSTLTVLAGVSGTGKSELPRLYSHFGGIQFINVPVQPNWDSKESMLGYFNSIDNRFEAQNVLRFLAQCTDKERYGNFMSIVLLDEMNLAHVELYFAEFLSKLEERRGNKKKIPQIEVQLGSGMPPYCINMSRNILWTGTMNQDETTNSLSDKVLDRGIVINFPRPTEFYSRKKIVNLDEMDEEPLLAYVTWKKWIADEIVFEGKQADTIQNLKNSVNRINIELEKVGRALGHRVWQSIEYYIANYPTVREELFKIKDNPDLEPGEISNEFKKAVKTAFEDQVVQKIMPKLRGIETSGIGEAVLSNIMTILSESGCETLEDDFNNAKELGYGQFMWSSAKYIEKSENLNNYESYDEENENENDDTVTENDDFEE